MRITRHAVLRYRVHAQQLDRAGSHDDAAVLDLGVQDTGPDGSGWALALRGWEGDPAQLFLAWTLRGAPHAYRRREARQVAAAVAPFSEADAAKRIFDAARPLRAAGIPVLEALDVVAAQMREIAARPIVKGELSSRLSQRLPTPYLRECRPCGAVHTYEQPFRLAALRAGLELEPHTSPPVLHRIPGWRGPSARVPDHLDPVRATLRLLGPATPQEVAGFLDAALGDVKGRWPEDAVEVDVDGARSWILEQDRHALADPPPARGVRLLGPFDLFLQGRDRERVLPDESARKDLWRTLGRPGGVLVDGEVVGSWRPRSAGARLRLAVTTWSGNDVPAGLAEQGERLADFRGQTFAGFV